MLGRVTICSQVNVENGQLIRAHAHIPGELLGVFGDKLWIFRRVLAVQYAVNADAKYAEVLESRIGIFEMDCSALRNWLHSELREGRA